MQEHRKIVYTQLLTSGRLNSYLAEIDQQAQEQMEVLVEQMKQARRSLNSSRQKMLWSGSAE